MKTSYTGNRPNDVAPVDMAFAGSAFTPYTGVGPISIPIDLTKKAKVRFSGSYRTTSSPTMFTLNVGMTIGALPTVPAGSVQEIFFEAELTPVTLGPSNTGALYKARYVGADGVEQVLIGYIAATSTNFSPAIFETPGPLVGQDFFYLAELSVEQED